VFITKALTFRNEDDIDIDALLAEETDEDDQNVPVTEAPTLENIPNQYLI
jgi:hypothetical protein